MTMPPINWHSCFFLLFAGLACALAIAVVLSGNIVRMAVYLVAALAAVAGLFFLAGANFLGAMQLMVYVGGTMVLLIFGVMLTARGPLTSMPSRGGQWIVAVIVGGALLTMLLQAAFSVQSWTKPKAAASEMVALESAPSPEELGYSLLGVRADKLGEEDKELGRGLSGYLLPFEIVSVHLLVVLVGAAYLARAKRRIIRVPLPLGEGQGVKAL
jgi:NADH-quinone oxidoreductase subunit J